MAVKNFNTQCRALGLTTNQAKVDYLRGKEIEIVVQSSHNYGAVGTKFTVGPYAYVSGAGMGGALENGGGNNIRWTEFKLSDPLTEKEILKKNDELKEEIKGLEEEIKRNLSRIEFMKEVGSDEYDDNEFKAYHTLKLVEDPDLSRAEKAKLIASLVNN